MRIGRIVAATTGAALAVFGFMRLKRSRSSDSDTVDSADSPELDLSTLPSKSNADESKMARVPE
jgi:hypothetical protein